VKIPTRLRSRRVFVALGTGALLAASGAALVPAPSYASSHREAPLIAGDPRADNTDLYAFVSPDKPSTVTLVSNWYPFEEPNGGPNFYPFATGARYNIYVDSDGDGRPNIAYRWTFKNHIRDASGEFLYNTGVVKNLSSKNLNFYQTYTLTETKAGKTHTLLKNKMVAPSDVGAASMPNYGRLRREAINQGQLKHGQTYVGQADDPFFLDLRVFDLLYGGNLSEAGHDTLSGYNVNTIALQVPKSALALHGKPRRNPVVGVWSTTDRRATIDPSTGKAKGKWVQVSRLGNPLVNEAVVPLKYKDAFNTLKPYQDHTVTPVVDKVKDPIVPQLIQKIYGIQAPPTPRNDLVEIFLTGICKACGPVKADLNSQLLNKGVANNKFVPSDELRLNMSVAPTAKPKRMGVLAGDNAGFPNGRRLSDDVVDIALQALEGAATNGEVQALKNGDGVNRNDVRFGKTFPYVALPHAKAVNQAASGKSSVVAGPGNGDGGGIGGHRVPIAIAAFAAAVLAAGLGFRARRRPLPVS
jgi:hypothetical protein